MHPRRYVAALCLAILLPSCTSWVEHSPGPPSVGERRVRITRTTGEQLTLDEPFVEGRDYVGSVNGISRQVPLDSIARYEVAHPEHLKTALVAVGSTVLVFAVVVAYVWDGSN